jgi:flavin-dependent dehydrogenase
MPEAYYITGFDRVLGMERNGVRVLNRRRCKILRYRGRVKVAWVEVDSGGDPDGRCVVKAEGPKRVLRDIANDPDFEELADRAAAAAAITPTRTAPRYDRANDEILYDTVRHPATEKFDDIDGTR